MPTPGELLPSGHRLARRLPVPGVDAWFVTHPRVPFRTWIALPVANPRAPWPHPLLARPVDRVAWPGEGHVREADLYAFDGGRLVADGPMPWRIEEVRRLAADMRTSLARCTDGSSPSLDPERLVWFARERRVEMLPGPSPVEGGAAWPVPRLFSLLLPPEQEPLPLAVLVGLDDGTIPPQGAPRARPLVQVAGFSVTGPVRAWNEDTLGWWSRPDGTTTVAVVDGLGGMGPQGGLAAARAALGAACGTGARRVPEVADVGAEARRVLALAQEEVVSACPDGGGASMVAAVIGLAPGASSRWSGKLRVAIGHVGNGRAYLVRSGQLSRLTRDHTLIEEKIAVGKLTPEAARTSPHRNILVRSLGPANGADAVAGDFTEVELDWRLDRLLLCTDGVWDAVPEAELHAALTTWDIRQGARRLLTATLDAAPRDNATALFIARE